MKRATSPYARVYRSIRGELVEIGSDQETELLSKPAPQDPSGMTEPPLRAAEYGMGGPIPSGHAHEVAETTMEMAVRLQREREEILP